MAILMPLPEKILRESEGSVTFRELSAQFGNGYRQDAPDGLNYKSEIWNVSWGGLTKSEYITVRNALDLAGCHVIILWTPNYDTVQKKFKLTKDGYSFKSFNNNIFVIRASFEEQFEVAI